MELLPLCEFCVQRGFCLVFSLTDRRMQKQFCQAKGKAKEENSPKRKTSSTAFSLVWKRKAVPRMFLLKGVARELTLCIGINRGW